MTQQLVTSWDILRDSHQTIRRRSRGTKRFWYTTKPKNYCLFQPYRREQRLIIMRNLPMGIYSLSPRDEAHVLSVLQAEILGTSLKTAAAQW